MMNRLAIRFKMALVLLLSLASLQSIPVLNTVQSAHAANCTPASTGPLAKIALYSVTGTSLDEPANHPNDPQIIIPGERTLKYVVETQDANGCKFAVPFTEYPSGLNVDISTLSPTIKFMTTATGTLKTTITLNIGNTASTESHASFYAKAVGMPDAAATITATATSTPTIANQTASQLLNVVAPVPVVSKIVWVDNPHGTSDSITGGVCAVVIPACTTPARANPFDGAKVHLYYSDTGGLNELGAGTTVDTNGAFTALPSGDDQYRTIFVRVEYLVTSSVSVWSDMVLVNQPYPSLVTDLKVLHGSTDGAQISWTATETPATFRIYRKLASDGAFTFLTSTLSTSYLDVTAQIGVAYQYTVKQVNAAGSYTPEFLPVAAFRFDIANVQLMSTVINAPAVTFVTSLDLAARPELIKAVFTNTATGAVYTGTLTQTTATGFKSASPYLDSALNPLTVLPDGTYRVTVSAFDVTLGINDSVTTGTNYMIDTAAPDAPVLSKLRFTDNVLSGIDGAVESNAFVDVYASDPSVSGALPVITVNSDVHGAFNAGVLSIPTNGIFYLVARDTAGNQSGVTMFNVVGKPVAAQASLVIMQQNNPGVADRIIGAPGAVTPGLVVRIFAADPSGNPNLVPIRETVALADGSFNQEVGDNLATAFWVAVWSGNGLLSDAIMLTNTTLIGTPLSFSVTPGDSSAVLKWSSVPGTSFYAITVYDVTTKENVQKGTVLANQTELVVNNLVNGHRYRFYINAVDAFGNVGLAVEDEATPHTKVIAQAAATTPPAEEAAPRNVAEAPAPAAEATSEVAPPAAPETPEQTSTTRDWTTWIIIGLGLLLLALAAFFGWQLWFKDSSETIVTTVKKTQNTPAAKTDASDKKPDNSNKPRW